MRLAVSLGVTMAIMLVFAPLAVRMYMRKA